MNPLLTYHFQWDDEKADANERKHGISFDAAAAVFLDPLAVTQYDAEHSEWEDRWYTVGQIQDVLLVAVFHTLNESESGEPKVRIVSARRATPHERDQYKSGRYMVREPSPVRRRIAVKDDEDMPAEIDFSGGERGKFYRENAVLQYPVYLDPQLLEFFSARAHAQGMDLTALLNQLLRATMLQEQAVKDTGRG
jgi:uncharacterized DUF497 family protein